MIVWLILSNKSRVCVASLRHRGSSKFIGESQRGALVVKATSIDAASQCAIDISYRGSPFGLGKENSGICRTPTFFTTIFSTIVLCPSFEQFCGQMRPFPPNILA